MKYRIQRYSAVYLFNKHCCHYLPTPNSVPNVVRILTNVPSSVPAEGRYCCKPLFHWQSNWGPRWLSHCSGSHVQDIDRAKFNVSLLTSESLLRSKEFPAFNIITIILLFIIIFCWRCRYHCCNVIIIFLAIRFVLVRCQTLHTQRI